MSKDLIKNQKVEKVSASEKAAMSTIANKIIELIRNKHV